MTHFLARLVDRARGTAPRVEPVIASRFASAGAIPEMEFEIVSEQTPNEREIPESGRQLTGPPLHPAVGIEVRPREDPFRPREAPGTSDAKIEPELVPKGFRTPPDPAGSLEPSRTNPPRERHPAPPRTPRSSRRTPPAMHPLQPARDGRQFADEPGQEAPIVRVTIGRIEVRAAPPPASPQRKAGRPAEPKLTLDAYLKSRKEGAR
ncbi:MAG: hypothetical protein QOE70_863 [Chthoniobacter sp.]|jgi:hypothetical protein|nr:hypothetical protein [Chthoniobacter sp.]